MAEVAAPKPKTVKPKGEKKETTQALIKEAIVALKVSHISIMHCDSTCRHLSRSRCQRSIVEWRDVCAAGEEWIFSRSHQKVLGKQGQDFGLSSFGS